MSFLEVYFNRSFSIPKVDNSYFVIYDLENGTDNNIILRINAALFNSLRNSGVRECVPQDFIN